MATELEVQSDIIELGDAEASLMELGCGNHG